MLQGFGAVGHGLPFFSFQKLIELFWLIIVVIYILAQAENKNMLHQQVINAVMAESGNEATFASLPMKTRVAL